MSVRIAPSVLAADLAALGEAVRHMETAGADQIHVDVMDGHFVPNLTMGPGIVAALKRSTRLPLDVHLMIEHPDRYLEAFVKAGASMVTVHAEVAPHLHRTLHAIRQLGAAAGVALNPSTPPEVLQYVLDDLDLVLVMLVNPGFGGQSFIPTAYEKIRRLRQLLGRRDTLVSVDGGVKSDNAARLAQAGAGVLVAGSSVFGAPDPGAAVAALRNASEVPVSA